MMRVMLEYLFASACIYTEKMNSFWITSYVRWFTSSREDGIDDNIMIYSELQIRPGIEDIKKIIFLIFQ